MVDWVMKLDRNPIYDRTRQNKHLMQRGPFFLPSPPSPILVAGVIVIACVFFFFFFTACRLYSWKRLRGLWDDEEALEGMTRLQLDELEPSRA